MSDDPNRHGTFDDVIRHLPYVRDMGFDVLYFPPIHPIGRKNRKGRNNSLTAQPGDPGSPYAIGSAEGGHEAIHPELGTVDDFRRLVAAAHDHGLEIALDFAIQAAPDHPWITQHPEYFDWRPDGTLKYAENPPKKYEDIVTHRVLSTGRCRASGTSCATSFSIWVSLGVKIYRVDNPHTKPLPVLGVGDPRGPGPAPGHDLPRRGLHPAQDDEAAGEARLHPVLQLLHVAEHQAGADGVPDRADARGSQGAHAPQLLRQHAGHQPALPADRRPAGPPDPRRPGRDALAPLGRLQRLRAVRGDADPGPGGVPRQREVRDQGLGPGPPGQHPRPRSRGSTASAARTRRSGGSPTWSSRTPGTTTSWSTPR